MKKIRYNIADKKKIDYLKFTSYSILVALISLAFIIVGISNLWSSDKHIRQQKDQALQDRQEIEVLIKENSKREEDVAKRKKEWKARVDFANWLVKEKLFSVTGKLDVLEKNLPEGVFFDEVYMEVENFSQLRIVIAANSLARLIEAYGNFSGYQPTIQNEKEEDGLLKAGLILHFSTVSQKSEKPEKVKQKKDEKINELEY